MSKERVVLNQVIEVLKDRLDILNSCIGIGDQYDDAMKNEVEFIEALIDLIEKRIR